MKKDVDKKNNVINDGFIVGAGLFLIGLIIVVVAFIMNRFF